MSHGSPGGILAWALIALVVLFSPPLVAAVTARSGQRSRDLRMALGVWIALNVASCSVPTGRYGAASDMVRFERFKAMAIAFVLTILAIRVWQYVRRRQASRT